LTDPEAGIFVGNVVDGGISIHIKPYCTPDNSPSLTSEIYKDLKEGFEKAGIKAPMPQRQVLSIKDTDVKD